MTALRDLERRTGVGAAGVLLYVSLLAVGLALALLPGDLSSPRTNPLVLLTGLGYAVGLLGVVSATANLPRFLLLTVARRRVGAGGTTALRGVVDSTVGTLPSPITGDGVVCYTYRVLENSVDDDPTPEEEANWSGVAVGEDGVPFDLVTDGGERVRVEPAGAVYHLAGGTEVFVDRGEDAPARLREFRRDEGIPAALPEEARRYEASVLAPGDDVFVLGRVRDAGRRVVRDGRRFVVADPDYPGRVRSRVLLGYGLGVSFSLLWLAALGFVAGVL